MMYEVDVYTSVEPVSKKLHTILILILRENLKFITIKYWYGIKFKFLSGTLVCRTRIDVGMTNLSILISNWYLIKMIQD